MQIWGFFLSLLWGRLQPRSQPAWSCILPCKMVLSTIKLGATVILIQNQVGFKGWQDQREREEAALVPRRLHLPHAPGRPHRCHLGG